MDKPRGEPPLQDATAPLLADLLRNLKMQGYDFVTPTPATHARVLARRHHERARSLRDIFGWSMPFDASLLDPGLLASLEEAGVVGQAGDALISHVRVSTLGQDLFLHSAYPTIGQDAVFFGPDSYRFAQLIEAELARCPQRRSTRLVDIGTGAGVGGIVAAKACPFADIVLTDINPTALRLARVNAKAAGVAAAFHQTGDLAAIDGAFDIALANPPYIIDGEGRAYRDGGDMHGAGVSLDMARQAVPRLAEGGRFILYTGSAIVNGRDALHERLADLARAEACTLRYSEIDPDVFGEELETPAYRDVERIALVAAIIAREA
ncbi:MAG: class I SAM-dependent methyltransferase [Sphingobium sp.]